MQVMCGKVGPFHLGGDGICRLADSEINTSREQQRLYTVTGPLDKLGLVGAMQKFICMSKSSQQHMICDSQQTKRSRPQYELRVRDWYRPPYRPAELTPQYLKATKSHRRWSRLKKSHRRWRKIPARLSMCDSDAIAKTTKLREEAKSITIRACSDPPKVPPPPKEPPPPLQPKAPPPPKEAPPRDQQRTRRHTVVYPPSNNCYIQVWPSVPKASPVAPTVSQWYPHTNWKRLRSLEQKLECLDVVSCSAADLGIDRTPFDEFCVAFSIFISVANLFLSFIARPPHRKCNGAYMRRAIKIARSLKLEMCGDAFTPEYGNSCEASTPE